MIIRTYFAFEPAVCGVHVYTSEPRAGVQFQIFDMYMRCSAARQVVENQGLDLVFGGVLDHFLARETALARPDMPLLDRFFRA